MSRYGVLINFIRMNYSYNPSTKTYSRFIKAVKAFDLNHNDWSFEERLPFICICTKSISYVSNTYFIIAELTQQSISLYEQSYFLFITAESWARIKMHSSMNEQSALTMKSKHDFITKVFKLFALKGI
jgi:CRISPR/Cas system Type II protein with McrA/HNH and RuvC-like nuclease domain